MATASKFAGKPASRFAGIFGAFRILRKRGVELGQPGLGVWADAGEAAATKAAEQIRDTAHSAEQRARGVAETLNEILADGKISAQEMKQLREAPGRITRVADGCHDIGEVVS